MAVHQRITKLLEEWGERVGKGVRSVRDGRGTTEKDR